MRVMTARPLCDYPGLRGRPVSLEEVLAARDRRAAIQSRLLASTGGPLLSMTLNMPGPVKRTALSSFFFDLEWQALTDSLRILGAAPVSQVRLEEETGDEAVMAVKGLEPRALKAFAVALETGSEAARLLDLDVLDDRGRPLNRETLGWAPRSCLLCRQPAFVCGSSRFHPLDDLVEARDRLLRSHAGCVLADMAEELALEASSFELMLTPKPGLVTPEGAGSHRDMDRFTFIRSQAALAPYYRSAFRLGWEGEETSLLRLAGIRAEAAMEEATGGVNTHRGWIYLSGLLLAAAGRYCAGLFAPSEGGPPIRPPAEGLAEKARELARELEEGLDAVPYFVRLKGRMPPDGRDSGIRQEALAGFPSIFTLGWPVLEGALASGEDPNTAGLRSFLAILAQADDSTLRRRGGAQRAGSLRQSLQGFLCPQGGSLVPSVLALPARQVVNLVRELAAQFETEGLTCGGAADLLAASRLVSSLVQRCQSPVPARL